jgi:hypothetical protein
MKTSTFFALLAAARTPARFGVVTLALLAGLAAGLRAESVVFQTDFSTDTYSVSPSVITPTGTTWCGAYSKASGTLGNTGSGLVLSGAASTSAAINACARITQSPINLANVYDYIELSGSFYSSGLQSIAIGLFNSGGVDPLTTLLNSGLATVGTAPGGGTFGWKGYRAMSLNASTAGSFVIRAAQTGTSYASYELLSVGVSAYSSPTAISVGTVTASPSSVAWISETAATLYGFTYRITRLSATDLSFSFIIRNASNVVYSTTGTTSSASAKPSLITSSFDAVAFGGRVTSTLGAPRLQMTTLKVTASNSDIAVIATQPLARGLVLGQAASLSVVAAGTGPFTYQWFKDGNALPGATSATYNVASASITDIGKYTVKVANAFGSETSAEVTEIAAAAAAPVFSTQPAVQSVTFGGTATFTATVTGWPIPTLQWFKGNTPLAGQTSASLTIPVVQLSDAGDYKVVATNVAAPSGVTSSTATLIVNTVPTVTTRPAIQSAIVGGSATFTATVTGSPTPTLQWFKGNTALAGKTNSTLTLNNVQFVDAGDDYRLVATNAAAPSGVTLFSATLLVYNVPVPAAPVNTPPVVVIKSATMRPGTTLMDVVFRVNDPDDASVRTRALAFIDGTRSFENVVKPVTFAEGTGNKIGDAIPSNTDHTVTWDVGADWNIQLGQIKFEILALDKRGLLPIDWITVPAAAGTATATVSKDTPSDANVLNALFWLYADGDPSLTVEGGMLKGNASSGVFSGLSLINSYTGENYAKPYIFKKMNVAVAQAYELAIGNESRAGLLNIGDWHAANRPYDDISILYAWGNIPLPSAPSANSFTAIAAGGSHSLALKNDGTVMAWGDNYYSQATIPVGLSGVTAIAAGWSYSLALKNDGTVVVFGWGFYGEAAIPVGLSGVTAIAAGWSHILALKSDGTVVAWGDNQFGQTTIPAGLSGVTAIAAGGRHSLALKSDGTVVAWGDNTYRQTTVPAGLSGVIAIAAGGNHSLALKSDGTVVAWGDNGTGQTTIPAGLSGVTAIAAGSAHSMALKSDGTVVAWGDNQFGQTTIPAGLSGVTAIAAGGPNSMAFKAKAR